MVKCAYCKGKISEGRYVVIAYKIGIKKGYCSSQCKNRAGLLRCALINPKKYTPKTLSKLDKEYMQDYVNELSLSLEERKGCN